MTFPVVVWSRIPSLPMNNQYLLSAPNLPRQRLIMLTPFPECLRKNNNFPLPVFLISFIFRIYIKIQCFRSFLLYYTSLYFYIIPTIRHAFTNIYIFTFCIFCSLLLHTQLLYELQTAPISPNHSRFFCRSLSIICTTIFSGKLYTPVIMKEMLLI